MPRSFVAVALALAAVVISEPSALGQVRKTPIVPAPGLGPPFVQSAFPPGITPGQSLDLALTGRRLESITGWLVPGTGLAFAEVKSSGPGKYSVQVTASGDAEPGIREIWAIGVDGISNLVLFRVDPLKQTLEAEPNDTPEKATPITIGSAVAATLQPQDLDYYRLEARAGQRVVIEVEAQRLGVGIAPLITLYSEKGTALTQGRERDGPEHDPRFAFTFPRDGTYILEVHDITYSGSPSAVYRLRVDTAPFATAIYPLGGRAGETVTVLASGGSLFEPLAKTITLPREPGALVDPGPFDSPEGPVPSPGKLIVGDGPEMNEGNGQLVALAVDTTVNGRLDRPGEVDRFQVAAKKGQALRFKVMATPLGSWLDSVLVLRDAKGNALAENDDPADANPNQRGRVALGLAAEPPDSRLEYTPKEDATLTLELLDRYGRGGPEYGYRLTSSERTADFTISAIIVNPIANRGVVVDGRPRVIAPGSTGSYTVKPGRAQLVNFLVTPEGFTGKVEVKAEGLPKGVSSTTTTVNLTPPARGRQQPIGGAIELRASADGEPGVAFMRIIATGKAENGDMLRREASAVLTFLPLPVSGPNAAPTRIVTRSLSQFPVALAGVAKPSAPGRKGAGGSTVAFVGVSSPPPLLQGEQIELKVVLNPARADLARYKLDAQIEARNLIVQTVLPDLELVSDTESEQPTPLIRIIAGPKCTPGPKTCKVLFGLKGAQAMVQELTINVRVPVVLRVPEKPVVLAPGGTVNVPIELRREPGATAPLTLHAENLPRGVKLVENAVNVDEGEMAGTLTLAMDADAAPLGKPVAFRVFGQIRMSRGVVRLESANRPMVMSVSAEK